MLNLQLRIASRSLLACGRFQITRRFTSAVSNEEEYTLKDLVDQQVEEPKTVSSFTSQFSESEGENDMNAYSYLKVVPKWSREKPQTPLESKLIVVQDLESLALRQREFDSFTAADLQEYSNQEWLKDHEAFFTHPAINTKLKLKFITHIQSMQTFDNLVRLVRFAAHDGFSDPALELQTLSLAFLATKVENRAAARQQIREALTPQSLEAITCEHILLATKLDAEFTRELISRINWGKQKQKKVLLKSLKELADARLLAAVVPRELARTLLIDPAVTDPLVFICLFQVFRKGDSYSEICESLAELQSGVADWDTKVLKLTNFNLQTFVGSLQTSDKLSFYALFDHILLHKKFTKGHRNTLIGLLSSMLTTGRVDCYFYVLRMKCRLSFT